jgi:DNA invertase Pin-like site-specific DNA recombinase
MASITRAATYVRVSTEEQVDGTSLGLQRESCLRVIDQRGWEQVGVFADEGVSGVLASRPSLDRLIEACRRHEVDVVVVARLDRFGRSLRHLSTTLGELDDLGVQFVSVHEAFDSLGPAGRLQRNILSSVAQYEREQMLERSRSGLRAKVKAGWWPGGPPPFGFRLERVGRHLRLTIDEQEAAVLRRAVDLLVDENLSTIEAAAILNAEGAPTRTGATWSYQNLRRYLLEAPLSGTWRYGRGRGWQRVRSDGIVHAQIPAIITFERHLELFEHLHRTSKGRQNPRHHSYFLLSRGLLWSPCGRPCTGVTNFGTGRRDYVCPFSRWRTGQPRCGCRNLYADDLETEVWDVVCSVLAQADAELDTAPGAEELDERLHQLDARICDAEVAIGRVALDLLGLDLSPGALRTVTADLTKGLQLLRHEKSRLETMLVTLAADPGRRLRLRQIAASTRGRLATMPAHERRSVCELLDVRITINAWECCPQCEGRRRVSGYGKANTCPVCHGAGQVPTFNVTGVWSEASA